MDLSEMQTRVAELEQQISALPAGSITKKTVNGKEYFCGACCLSIIDFFAIPFSPSLTWRRERPSA